MIGCVVLGVWLALLSQPTALAVTEVGPTELAREILSDSRYQTELPTRGGDGRFDRESEGPSWLAGPVLRVIATMLLWGLGIVVAVVLLGVLARAWSVRSPAAEREYALPASEGYRPDTRPLEEAGRLAAAGRFAEALHVLLLRLIDGLVRYEKLEVVPSMTTREIVASTELTAERQLALRTVVDAVELSLFGLEESTGADYERCAGHYRDLIEAWETDA